MPKPIETTSSSKGIPEPGDAFDTAQQMTTKEVSDEIEEVRLGLWALHDRLEKLSWALMTCRIKPKTVWEADSNLLF